MPRMIRKQIYIERRHQALLEQRCRSAGISEAELIRQALDQQSGGAATVAAPADPVAWATALRVMEDLHARGALRNRPRSWKREDAYGARLNRRARRSR